MSDDVRADARRLLAGITPGPWVAEYSREQGNCVIPADARSTREAVAVTHLYHQVADAEFIAAAPALVDRLLAELDQALATIQQVRDAMAPVFSDKPMSEEQVKGVVGKAILNIAHILDGGDL